MQLALMSALLWTFHVLYALVNVPSATQWIGSGTAIPCMRARVAFMSGSAVSAVSAVGADF